MQTLNYAIYLPKKILTNNDIENKKVVLKSGRLLTANGILEKIGVEKRHIANSKEDIFYMAEKTAKKALGKNQNVDFIITSTSHPTNKNLAATLRTSLGLKNSEILDIHAACSGTGRMFTYLFENKKKLAGKKILMVAADKMSPTLIDLSRKDALTLDPSLGQTIFGDGAAALYFTLGENIDIIYGHNEILEYKDGKDCIVMGMGKNKFVNPFVSFPVERSKNHKDFPNGYFTQNGPKVYLTVNNKIPNIISRVVQSAELTTKDINLVIIHPGSKRVVDAIRESLPKYKIFSDYRNGNMSSTSLLYSFIQALKTGLVKKNNKIVLCGFGAGSPYLYSATTVIKLVNLS